MQISEVQISIVKPNNGLIAFASIVIDGSIYLSSIAIHQKLNGSSYRLTYPTKKMGNQNIGLFYPISKNSTRIIEEAIFKKLKDVMKGNNNARYNSFNS